VKRVVLDTNIIISSALGGALVLVLEKWDEVKLISS
jgi:predicted nucleic acid-binding protein